MKRNVIEIKVTLKDKRLNPKVIHGYIQSIQNSYSDKRINVYIPEEQYCLSVWKSEAEYIMLKRVAL